MHALTLREKHTGTELQAAASATLPWAPRSINKISVRNQYG